MMMMIKNLVAKVALDNDDDDKNLVPKVALDNDDDDKKPCRQSSAW